jgi:hypothetical protein
MMKPFVPDPRDRYEGGVSVRTRHRTDVQADPVSPMIITSELDVDSVLRLVRVLDADGICLQSAHHTRECAAPRLHTFRLLQCLDAQRTAYTNMPVMRRRLPRGFPLSSKFQATPVRQDVKIPS